MSKIFNKSALASGLLAGMLAVSGQASAHLAPGGVVVDFDNGVFSDGSTGPMPAAVFPAFGNFYQEDGVRHSAIGFGTAPGNSIGVITGSTSHLHGSTAGGSRASFLEPDSGGGFFDLADGDAFSVQGLDIAQIDLSLVGGGYSTMTFRGYTSADYSTFFDVVVSDNGAGIPGTPGGSSPIDAVGGVFNTEVGAAYNGTHLHLDGVAEFGSLYLLEYFFDAPGRGNDPGTTAAFANLGVKLDNVALGPVSAVPVPAAAYLFGTALLGLGGLRKKKRLA